LTTQVRSALPLRILSTAGITLTGAALWGVSWDCASKRTWLRLSNTTCTEI